MKALSKGQTALFLAFLILMWGVNWPLSKFALNYAPPILFSGIRTLIAGLLLLVVALPHLRDLRWKQTWKIYAISAILNIILFYGCQTIGIAYMPAGLFSAIVFLLPVLVGFLSWLWVGESMNPLKAVGLILGCAGVATISA
ncbi:DMT family transporter, partial [Salmonella enterica subsp. enterica serovar Enteritidis]|nr:DMT family transporter [Salmonella enterica subsp. enterica serovar Enteritidis]